MPTDATPTASDDPLLPQDARDVLAFWLGDALAQDWPSTDPVPRWFSGGAALDREITTRFGAHVQDALAGDLQEWEQTPLGRLALVILLDQFTRNVYRGRGEAFSGDARAQRITQAAFAAGDDARLPLAGRVFLRMPLEHAEDRALQDDSVRRFEELAASAPPALAATFASNLEYARVHRDIVARFGRFPHRNQALGRQSTPEEVAFLHDGPRFGQ